MIKKKPYISIVTPNYNGDSYIEETIKSVLNQSDKDYEYIIVDGASKDNSLNIINSYKKYITFISETDAGLYHAVDKGIKMARGEVIIWVNSDDILHLDAVKNVKKIFEDRPDLAWANGISGYIKYNFKFSLIPYIYPNWVLKKGLAMHHYWGYVQQESTAFRKSLYEKVGGFDFKHGNAEDYFLWLKFCKHSNLETFFFNIGYFRTRDGQNSQVHKKQYLENIQAPNTNFSFRLIRFIVSLFFMPFVFLKTILILKKCKK